METEANNRILLVNDIVGCGRMGGTAMAPILGAAGYECCYMPTALVSNNFAYGEFGMLDTTSYISDTIGVWGRLGFTFKAIATGVVMGAEQAAIVADFCRSRAEEGATVFVDPVMGDGGSLYNGMTAQTVEGMKKLLSSAHVACPNYTEACLLTGTEYRKEGTDAAGMRMMADAIAALGAKSVVVTSAVVDGQSCVAGYDHAGGGHFALPYDEIPTAVSGTGDVFSAVLYAELLRGGDLQGGVQKAMDTVRRLIEADSGNPDPRMGIRLERHIGAARP